jgi:hypothetical protein
VRILAAAGAASGVATAAGQGAAIVAAAGSASGAATAAGQTTSAATVSASGTASGVASAIGDGRSTVSAVGTAAGSAVVIGRGPSLIASRFAFPGDPANGGKLAMSRDGGLTVNEVSVDTFFIKRNDTTPAIRYKLKPAAVDLTGATVQFQMRARRPRGAPPVIDTAAVVVTETGTPTVEYTWQEGDTDNAGVYEAEFRVTYANNEVETFPNDGFISVKVSEDIQ